MGAIRDRMQQDLERAGYSKGTVENYVACARQFVEHCGGRSPLKLGQDEMRAFVAKLERRKLSAQRMRQYLAALKFLYSKTLGRPDEVAWVSFPRTKRRMRGVLSGSEVARVIGAIECVTCRTMAMVCYGAGLRLDEVRHLEVTDILSDRGLLHVRAGKGGHERFAMLSPRLLTSLREYWRAARPRPPLLFASKHGAGAVQPKTLRTALREAARAANVSKHVTPHVLRHSFATHLLEMGVELRIIQQLLGHASIRSTAVYAQVTSALVKRTKSPLDVLGTVEAEILG
ncbi:MAG: site-specific integrase [Deltaproteobacteria bacterium]|nr:site-specific integrase [Deltaproteobacteria bacterium]MBN8613023.1 site-specific integrase [Deltaproteobacteria bacterium]